jgi:hypothetical protein
MEHKALASGLTYQPGGGGIGGNRSKREEEEEIIVRYSNIAA